jgi:hypothetical protein
MRPSLDRFAWLALGVPALYPACYLAAFIVVVPLTVGLDGRDPTEPDIAATLRPLHLAAAVLTVLALTACLAHLRRSQPDPTIRKRKAARLIVGSVFVIPFYWWNEMRPKRSPDGEREEDGRHGHRLAN